MHRLLLSVAALVMLISTLVVGALAHHPPVPTASACAALPCR